MSLRLLLYFARFCGAAILLTLFGLIIVMVAVSLVENAGRLSDLEAGAANVTLSLALYGAVEYAYQVLPVACLIGALVAGTQLARRGELLAVQAAGIHTRQLWAAFLAVTGVIVLAGAAGGEYLVPRAVAAMVRVQREDVRHVDALTLFYSRRAHWFRDGDLLLYLPIVDARTQTFRRPIIYRLSDELIDEVVEAEVLRHDGDGWWLDSSKSLSVTTAEVVERDRMAVPLSVSPADLIDVAGNPREMTSAEVRTLIARRENAGFDATAHRVEVHNRIAFPLSGLWMVLIVLPWALNPQRRRSLAVTLGAGVVFVAVELAVTQTFRLLALGHKVPVLCGAWGGGMACLLAVPLSAWLYGRYRIRGSVI